MQVRLGNNEQVHERQQKEDPEHGGSSGSTNISGLKNVSRAQKEWLKISPQSPRNWPLWRKWWILSGLLFYTFIVFIDSTGFVTDQAQEQFEVSTEVSILAQSMFILGLAIGVSSPVLKHLYVSYLISNSQCSLPLYPKSMDDSPFIQRAFSCSLFCRFPRPYHQRMLE